MTDLDKRIDEIMERVGIVKVNEGNRKRLGTKASEYYYERDIQKMASALFSAREIISALQAELAARDEALQRIASKPLTQDNGEANNCISIARNALGLPLMGAWHPHEHHCGFEPIELDETSTLGKYLKGEK